MKLKILLLMLTLIFAAGCTKNNTITVADGKGGFKQVEDTSNKEEKVTKGDISTNICEEFTPDFIYSVLKKPIVRVEPSKIQTVYACDYFTDYKADFYKDTVNNRVSPGGPSIGIVLDNLNVEKQKEARKLFDLTLDTSSKINMENILSYREDKSLWSVDLIINPNRFVWANYSNKAITDEELITLAAAMADKIQGRLNIKIEKNPVDLAVKKDEALEESQIKLANQFFVYLSDKKIPEALAMMDADKTTKQGWGANFNTLNSLKIETCAEDTKSEWTAGLQRFKCRLDVSVKPEGEQMGWSNGANTRWLMLTKTGDKWFVHELANN
jgi:hypothetical protein